MERSRTFRRSLMRGKMNPAYCHIPLVHNMLSAHSIQPVHSVLSVHSTCYNMMV